MSKITDSTRLRIGAALLLYFIVVVVASVAFQCIRQEPRVPPLLYAVCGPALSLFTHMSYFLFAQQSILLVPWLIWAAVQPRATLVATVGFSAVWLAIGWYMHDLF